MIRYSLVCGNGHEFEGWFRNSEAYDKQAKRGALACAVCGDAKIEKALMAPKILKGSRSNPAPGESPSPAPVSAPQPEPAKQTVATPDAIPANAPAKVLELVRKLREEIVKSAEYVGPRFAEEARKIHYEEAESRGIYGEASLEEARELVEEGIEILPVPKLPEDQN